MNNFTLTTNITAGMATAMDRRGIDPDCCVSTPDGVRDAVFDVFVPHTMCMVESARWCGTLICAWVSTNPAVDAALNRVATHVLAREMRGAVLLQAADAYADAPRTFTAAAITSHMNARAGRSWAGIAHDMPKTFTDKRVSERLAREFAEQQSTLTERHVARTSRTYLSDITEDED